MEHLLTRAPLYSTSHRGRKSQKWQLLATVCSCLMYLLPFEEWGASGQFGACYSPLLLYQSTSKSQSRPLCTYYTHQCFEIVLLHTHTHIHTHTYTHTYTHMYTHTYTHIYTHSYTYTHTHTCTILFPQLSSELGTGTVSKSVFPQFSLGLHIVGDQ